MPVIRYFVFVGGALLAILLSINLFAPPQPVVAGQAAADEADGQALAFRRQRRRRLDV